MRFSACERIWPAASSQVVVSQDDAENHQLHLFYTSISRQTFSKSTFLPQFSFPHLSPSALSDSLHSLSLSVSVDFLWPQGSSISTALQGPSLSSAHTNIRRQTHTHKHTQSTPCLWGCNDRDLQFGPPLPSGVRLEEMLPITGMWVCACTCVMSVILCICSSYCMCTSYVH